MIWNERVLSKIKCTFCFWGFDSKIYENQYLWGFQRNRKLDFRVWLNLEMNDPLHLSKIKCTFCFWGFDSKIYENQYLWGFQRNRKLDFRVWLNLEMNDPLHLNVL
ncbi:hypothetical protein JL49_17175 [Pseudoalteromonas luteoviolacea]|nr:hypothetical protein JL49_17175 [Pseudoalteromonas luteoviolacea]